jgi:hypothetical protein
MTPAEAEAALAAKGWRVSLGDGSALCSDHAAEVPA